VLCSRAATRDRRITPKECVHLRVKSLAGRSGSVSIARARPRSQAHLRAALAGSGVGLETRRVLLGHKNDDITAHYSPAELRQLLEAVERLAQTTPATLLKVVGGA